MIQHCKGLELEITDFEYRHDWDPQLKLYHLKPQFLKHVEIIKVQIITKFNASLERS